MGIGGILKAAVIGTVALLLMGVGLLIIGIVPILNFLNCVGAPVAFVIATIVLLWLGHEGVKGGDFGVGGAAASGMLVGLASSVINAGISFLLGLLGIGVGAALSQDQDQLIGSLVGGGLGVGVGAVYGIAAICFWAFYGAITCAIGGLVAGGPKK